MYVCVQIPLHVLPFHPVERSGPLCFNKAVSTWGEHQTLGQTGKTANCYAGPGNQTSTSSAFQWSTEANNHSWLLKQAFREEQD